MVCIKTIHWTNNISRYTLSIKGNRNYLNKGDIMKILIGSSLFHVGKSKFNLPAMR